MKCQYSAGYKSSINQSSGIALCYTKSLKVMIKFMALLFKKSKVFHVREEKIAPYKNWVRVEGREERARDKERERRKGDHNNRDGLVRS